MNKATNLSQTIDLVSDIAKYDKCAKKLLAYKAIAAWILKSTTKEFSQYSIKFIMKNCLKGNPEISSRAVHQDQPDSDTETGEMLDGDETLGKDDSESTSVKEQSIYYDIRFTAIIPNSDEPVLVYVNFEVQVDDKPGYPIIKRALYYCSRMISEQYGRDFNNEHYEKIHNVMSVWICPSPAQKRENGIFRYHLTQDEVHGRSEESKENYDLIEAVIINLGDAEEHTDNELLNLLNVLFSSKLKADEKKKILNDDYKIAMTEEFERGVNDVCTLGEALVRQSETRGIAIGEKRGETKGENKLAKLIKMLMDDNRTEDVVKVSDDEAYRKEMYKKYKIID